MDNALRQAAQNLLNNRADFEDLQVELDILQEVLTSGTDAELLQEALALLTFDACPYGDMSPAFQQLADAAGIQ